jgi:thiamine-monophosphate kinase
MKVKDIGEFALIDRISKKSKNKDVLVDIGDDAAVIKAEGLQVLTTDCLVEGDHFRRDWFSAQQVGMKTIEINVSDIAAMGAIPTYVLVSLALPHDVEVEFVENMYKGMWQVCEKYNIDIIGGNMTHANQIMLSITLIGTVDKRNLSRRSDARPGDTILVSGHLGNGRAGLRSFQEQLSGFHSIKKKYVEPTAKIDFALHIAPYVNAMIDISDGLAPELRHICDESSCGAILYKENIPILDDVRNIAKTLHEDEYDYALFGGEDFELLYTVSKEYLPKVKGIVIGEITKDDDVFLFSNGHKEKIQKKGYDHFSNGIVLH